MSINGRIEKLEQELGLQGPPPEWAIQAASGFNTVELIEADVQERKPALMGREDIMSKAREIFKEHGTEEAYIESLRTYKLPANIDVMLREMGC